MKYAEFEIDPRLAPHVRVVWSLETADDGWGVPDRILPDGITETVFHFDERCALRFPGGDFEPLPRSFSILQVRRYVELLPTRGTGFVSVRFQPWGFCHFVPMSLREMADHLVTARDLWGIAAVEVEERLAEVRTLERRVDIVQSFLVEQLRRHEREPVAAMVRAIWSKRGQLRVRDLGRELGISERQLQRRFRDALGLSPKHYARLTRFLHACRSVRGSRRPLTEIAHRHGYYDQAHFIDEFRAFAGETPGKLRARSQVSYLEIP